MNHLAESQRLDTLLALAITFYVGGAHRPRGLEQAYASQMPEVVSELFSAHADAQRRALVNRAEWYAQLDQQKRTQWLEHTVARALSRSPHLDEHVHPSQIVEALSDEPTRVRNLVLGILPPVMAATCAAALHVARRNEDEGANAYSTSALAHDAPPSGRSNASTDEGTPRPEVAALVRRSFLCRFISADELHKPTQLDLLTGIELVRLVRLLGVSETAAACRGIEEVEDVGAFLRRFSAEDASAITKQLATLTNVEQARVAFAYQLVQESFNMEKEAGAMVDRLGLRLLAIALAGQESVRVRYTAQKLPMLAAHAFTEMLDEGADRFDRATVRQIARDAETIAHTLRRSRKRAI